VNRQCCWCKVVRQTEKEQHREKPWFKGAEKMIRTSKMTFPKNSSIKTGSLAETIFQFQDNVFGTITYLLEYTLKERPVKKVLNLQPKHNCQIQQ